MWTGMWINSPENRRLPNCSHECTPGQWCCCTAPPKPMRISSTEHSAARWEAEGYTFKTLLDDLCAPSQRDGLLIPKGPKR